MPMTSNRGILGSLMGLLLSLGGIDGFSLHAADEFKFEVQHLITDNNEGLAVGDINRDGAPDIVAGRHWFEGPKFAAHPLRDVAPFGKDYLENNGDHLYDVNQDGWLDVVSGSFVPSKVYWFENPGAEGLKQQSQWPSHLLVDTELSSNEISFLRDLNGDGKPEFVVNSWNAKADLVVWEFDTGAEGQPVLKERLLGRGRHGHGMGFGDLNGDGLEDILVATGWYERPEGDPFARLWTYHTDWKMDRPSCPMIVTDLNEDGRNDLIIGAGHDYGLWWWEQLEPAADGKTQWKVHEMDRSFSQAHALEYADLNQDGQPELITGKRIYAHSGKDPGADDQPGIFIYEWDRPAGHFHRHDADAGQAGTGLQIRSADLDGDGDTDLAMPGKSGTHLLINQQVKKKPRASAESVRPNIIFILADDLGWSDLPCYGNEFNEAPHLDRMAAEGMRFTDFYAAASICSPTRASIFSGQYPARLGMTDFVPGHWRPFEKLIVPENASHLPLEMDTPAELLKSAGYRTGYFGKWHLGGGQYHPSQQGFEEAFVTGGRHFTPHFRTDPRQEIPDGVLLADWLTDQTLDFITRHQEERFFVTLAHFAVHIPIEARRELVEKYRAKPAPEHGINHPVYAAMIEDVDRNVGRVFMKLSELGLDDNTLVVFTSDNGGLRKIYTGVGEEVTDNAPLRNEKGSLYEGGIRVPLIVRWPMGVPAGSICSEPTISIDFLPTFREVAGASMKPNQIIDGLSLVPLFQDPGARLDRDAIYFHYPHYHHSEPAGVIRSRDWKLVEFFGDGRTELFNLKWDLGEGVDQVEERPGLVSSLQQQLAAWRQRVSAKMPVANPDHDPERASEWWNRRSREPLDLNQTGGHYNSRVY